MFEPPAADAAIVFTKHADHRLAERCGDADLDRARDEIAAALGEGRVKHQGRGYWLCWTPDFARRYALARARGGAAAVVVLTVMVAPALAQRT